jgi:gamma-glutamylcysteine synthetase
VLAHEKVVGVCALCLLAQDFMAGKLAEYPGEKPTKNDWMNHLGNIYPEVCRFIKPLGDDAEF